MKKSTMREIDSAWLDWIDENGVTIPRPRRWQEQILAELGLGKTKMIEFIDAAMEASGDSGDTWDVFISRCIDEIESRDRFDTSDFKGRYRKRR